MTTSRKSGQHFVSGEEQLRNCWKTSITAEQITEKYQVPGELALRLTDLLASAKDCYETFKSYQDSLRTPTLRSARAVAKKIGLRLRTVREEWEDVAVRDQQSAAIINWHAAYNSDLRIKKVGGQPPDAIAHLLRQIEVCMGTIAEEVTALRTDSNNVWREAMHGLVLFCHHEAGWPLHSNFAGFFYPDDEADGSSVTSTGESPEDDQYYPIPSHTSQWFLFDCMRYLDAEAANTGILQSLLNSDWMPDGPKLEEIDGTEAYNAWRRRRQR